MKPVDFRLSVASNTQAALSLLTEAGPTAKFLAGGQSLVPMLNLRLARPSALVSLGRAADLRGVTESSDSIIYGAAVTHAEIEDGVVPDATPGWLAQIAGGIAYRAVRNRGTIGGSLVHADPAADWIVTLTALGAELITRSPAGSRVVPMPGFMAASFATTLAPGEVVTGIRVPKAGPGARFGYWKFTRKTGAFAKASAAVLIDPARHIRRIAVGALEAPPILLPACARLIANPEYVADALAEALPLRTIPDRVLHAEAVRRAIRAAQQ